MKKYMAEFVRRGMTACGLGPVVLAVFYLVLQRQGAVETLTVNQVCVGIFSLTALAFVAGGMNVVYQAEQIPLMVAVFIHGLVLYISYLVTYLVNGWLELGAAPVLVFTAIFLIGYMAIWAVIYCTTRRNTDRINKMLKEKQGQNGRQR